MPFLTNIQANKVWDLLVQNYGATEKNRSSFVAYLTRDPGYGHEYRFMGVFGGGGKLHLRSYWGLSADYYPESETPEREKKMETLNLELQAMWEEFQKNP